MLFVVFFGVYGVRGEGSLLMGCRLRLLAFVGRVGLSWERTGH